ncbi:MAG: hypothetical protein ACK4GT_15395 [Pararhodobacter sp.]
MPKHLKAARLWSVVAAALLLAGAVSLIGNGAPESAALAVSFSTAI